MAKKDKEKSVKDTKTTENATNSNVDNDVKTAENATNSNVDNDVKTVENATNSNADNDVKTAENAAKTTEGKTGLNVDADVKVDTLDSHVIQPVGYSVKLRDIHPQDSYGRCGYRFNKTDATYFSVDELTGEQVVTLAEDPWLELIPVCEE
ncbi:hypothetical protein ACFGY2_02685 [Pasteurella multocida]|nr:hypothetical protein AAUPMG_11636 [Pasteurella multocida subsp. multocida str. Anand1_goat]